MLPFDLNRLTDDDGMTVIARAVMTLLWSHKDGHTTSAVEMAKQLGCDRQYVTRGMVALARLRWLVIQDVRSTDDNRRSTARRYHLQMERPFTDQEVDELSRPILLTRNRTSREHLATPSLTLSSQGDHVVENSMGDVAENSMGDVAESNTSLDEELDHQLDDGAARRRTRARARTLIQDNISDTGRYLSSELKLLTTITASLLADPACCQQATGLALQEWELRDDLGPRALPEIVSDVLKIYPQLRPPRTHPDVSEMQGEGQ
ncbi:hypothetical protein A5633_03405 [Mycolicibacterium elephantis]|uniref:hypothetical protein n=1 Tax=Mycolicibacterium elephantis TaxID=81858 RepID=UPI0007EA0067|nr:hypothetical protein [Mycolicibacterium elephantis]OBA65740.1 hypothetical protein A5633_03405 [Mycolicibacterium elephantis]